ncbi:MAG: serine protease [Proteobacteria bacterium]|nr:serine protease [Pseudomonadota bacterium]MBU1233864.1 serine protease [Pseudomonadota bacterium]MBU1417245.1 serine protease [Pseudomonadota bacterium]MBU1455047.1 serine protease [Pseudomonadota bacterium]
MKAHWVMSGTGPQEFIWQGGEGNHPEMPTGFGAVIGSQNFKEIWWLEAALKAARSVARVKLPAGAATGFLVGPDLFMTNHHVFENEDDARSAILQFNYRLSVDGDVAERDEWQCVPDSLFKTNPELDYTLVRVQQKENRSAADVWGFLNLRHGAEAHVNQRVNIIQHPQGRFQQIAFRDNQVKAIGDNFIQYLTDTDYGTSGSPVFDDWFHVVALHNMRVPDPSEPYRWYRNQGYKIEAILADAGALIPV